MLCRMSEEAPVTAPAPPLAPVHAYWTFAGPIGEDAVTRTVRNIPLMMQTAQNGRLHFLMQSTGGMVGDGLWFHNFFKTCPRDLTVYNAGTLASIAVIAYLGSPKRVANANATFMIHRTTYQPQPATATNLKKAARILEIDDGRTEAILRDCANLTEDHWRLLEHQDLWLTAEEAKAVGIVHEIGDFTPPMGGPLFAVI
jgi:ATP-dependent Clp protease, protease subunit